MLIGGHFPISGGFDRALQLTVEANGNTVQIFTKSPGQWKSRNIDDSEARRFAEVALKNNISPIVVHGSYLINLASDDDVLYHKSVNALTEEIKRAEMIAAQYVIIHMGAHKGSGVDEGLKKLAMGLETCIVMTQKSGVMILLETTAGMGTHLGCKFEHIAGVMKMCGNHRRIGACIDTCHIFTAGYDISTPDGYKKTFHEFDGIVGIEKLKVIHINDSKKPLGSRIDRHEYIGKGCIGIDAFRELVNDQALDNIPLILETPEPELMHKEQLKLLLSLKR
jgi:deoxyribonuclease IV